MNKNKWILVSVLIVLVSLLYFAKRSYVNDLPKEITGRWQAVFLSDGQVYFGRLENENRNFARLTNVYYLKYANLLQQEKGGTGEVSPQNLNLVKLGGEVHGPEDIMFIAKDKILFIENLKDSSIVVKAIKSSL